MPLAFVWKHSPQIQMLRAPQAVPREPPLPGIPGSSDMQMQNEERPFLGKPGYVSLGLTARL